MASKAGAQAIPHLPLHALRAARPEAAAAIEARARELGKPVDEFLQELTRQGWEARQVQKDGSTPSV